MKISFNFTANQIQSLKHEETKKVLNNSLVASKQQNASVPQRLDPTEVEKIRSRNGPVTHQKATQIVGMAIAKAMARESSVRRDSLSSDGSSLVGTPTSVSTPESEELPAFPKEGIILNINLISFFFVKDLCFLNPKLNFQCSGIRSRRRRTWSVRHNS